MTLKRLSKHLGECHDIFFEDGVDCTLDEWLRADEEWQDLMKTDPPNPHPCDYYSKKGKEDSESDSQSEEEKKKKILLCSPSLPPGFHTWTVHKIAPPVEDQVPKKDFIQKLTSNLKK